jgi:hypothetical protein
LAAHQEPAPENPAAAHAAPTASDDGHPRTAPPPLATVAHIGKRAAQVGGVAVAAYVIAAVASGQAVADADTASQSDSVSSSASRDAGSPDDDDATRPSPPERDGTDRSERAELSADRADIDDADTDDENIASDDAPTLTGDRDDDEEIGDDTSDTDDLASELASPTALDQVAGPAPTAGSDTPATAEDVEPALSADPDPLPAASSPVLTAVTDVDSAVANPAPAIPSAAATATPPAPPQADVDWTLLGWIRRTLFNRSPVIEYSTSLNLQDASSGVITGNIGAVDPEGDRLTYTLVTGPRSGTIVIDELTGNFTFTPAPDLADSGGVDFFTVKVSDGKDHLLSTLFARDRGVPTARIPVVVAALSSTESSAPPLETFEVEKVITFDVPEGHTVTGADLTPDGEHLLLEVKVGGNTHIGVSNLDGGEYQCLSCGLVPNATKARVLEDNKRIWFANTSGQQSADDPLGGAGAITYAVLECEGSITSCGERTVKKVEFPSDRRWFGLLPTQNREAKPDPFGEYVTWTENTIFTGPRMSIANLVATEKGYTLKEQRIFSPQWDEGTDYALDFANATRFYEGASWHAGGRYLKYQTTTTGLNYDIYLLDTLTGERRQLTSDLDYNESGDVSPDGNWVYYSSARGLDRMDVFTALQRPSLLDSAAFPQIGRVSLWNNRRSMNEPWMMDLSAGQQLGGYAGQPIVVDPDWTIRGWSWFPDSTRAVINEQQRPDGATPGAPDTPWRISIISFPSRTPTAALEPVHQDPAAIATWSVPVKDYHPMMGRQVGSRELKGAYSGTATLRYGGIFAWGKYSVTYENYSDDGKTFINGTEKVTVFNPMGNSVWQADLTSTGERTGYLAGTIKVGKSNAFSGEVTSEINGVTYSGVPTQAELPAITQPQLAISVAGDSVRVTASVAEDGQPRPVRGATVTVGGVTTTTDENGYAHVAFVPGDTITAVGGGFRSASQLVSPL